jgi:hypothetical protein
LAVLQGDPGVGKTTIAMTLAAANSTGQPFPGERETRSSRETLIFAAEDGLADTIVPRLQAAQADLSLVHIEDVYANGPHLALPDNLALLDEAIDVYRPGLVIIDPVMGYLGDVDSHKDAEVRKALIPLATLIEKHNVACLALMHNNKGGGTKAIYRAGGSIAFMGVARLVLLADKDPESEGSYVLASTKCNIGPPPRSLSYTITGAPTGMGSKILWGGESQHTADSLLEAQQERHRPGPKPESLDIAVRWLTDYLSNGPKKRSDVEEEAGKLQIKLSTLANASRKLGVVSGRVEGNWRERTWSLPGHC